MMESARATTSNGEEIYRIEGVLTELQVARTKVNLLEQLRNRPLQKKSAGEAVEIAAVMQSAIAMAAPLTLYDGEETFNFAGVVDGNIVCGVFEEADKLISGDLVSAIVSKRGNVLFVHSLQRVSDHLLMLPAHAICGPEAFFKDCMRVAWRMTRLLWVFMGTIFMVFHMVHNSEDQKYLMTFLIAMLAPPIVIFPMEYWSYRTMAPTGDYAECIFKLYGFPNPEYFNAAKGMDLFPSQSGGFIAINSEKAIEIHRKRYKMW
jgi:hypothetical protein